MRARLVLTSLLVLTVLLPGVPAAAGGGRCAEGFTDGDGPDVSTSGGCFLPTVVRVAPGDTVTWRSGDGMGHNVVTSAGFGGDLPPKVSLTHTFDRPGVYPYVCTLHPGMVGAVVVGDGVPIGTALTSATAAPSASQGDGDPTLWWTLAAAAMLLAPLLLRARRGKSAVDSPAI